MGDAKWYQIFVSYDRDDVDRTRQLVEALEGHGWTVFWDEKIPAGEPFRAVLDKHAETANAVVVVWSKASAKSAWVKGEARIGHKRRVLVPVKIDPVNPPSEFPEQAFNLLKWADNDGPLPDGLLSPLKRLIGERDPVKILEERVGFIRAAKENYPERVRRELLGIVDDYREVTPADLRALAVDKARDFMSKRREVMTGCGDERELQKIVFEMVKIAETIFDHVDEMQKKPAVPPAQEDPAPAQPNTKVVPPPRPREPTPVTPKLPIALRTLDPDAPVVCRATNVSKQFSSTRFALAPLSFELKLGQITALVGRNGSGKSTLLSMVRDEFACDTGTIEYPLLEEQGLGRQVKANIGYVAQRPPRWRGRLRETLEFTAAAYGLRGKANIERVNWILTRFGLIDREDDTWAELSGGYQLRFELGRALLNWPQLLILDEPLANLDIISQQEFLEDLRDLADSRLRAAILVTSQHLFEMDVIADQLILLQEGQHKYLGERRLIGEHRRFNSFEISIEATEPYLRKVLAPCRISAVRTFATHYQLDFPLDVPRSDILTAISALGVSVTYIRDISNSSRAMMGGADWQE